MSNCSEKNLRGRFAPPFSRVLQLIDSQGLTGKTVAARMGYDYAHYCLVMSGRRPCTPGFLRSLASTLGATVDELNPGASPVWNWFHKSCRERLNCYTEQLANASGVLTIMKSLDSYIQEDWMLTWSNRDWLQISDWEAHQQVLLPYVTRQRSARARSNSVQRLVFPWNMLTRARGECEEWLAHVRRGFGEFEEVTGAVPVKNWSRLREAISCQLPVSRWNKLCILDGLAVYVHVDNEFHIVCQHEPTVNAVMAHCERCIQFHEPSFPLTSRSFRPGLRALRSQAYALQTGIERLLVDPDAAELATGVRLVELVQRTHPEQAARLWPRLSPRHRRYPQRHSALPKVLGRQRDAQSHGEEH